MELSFEVVGGVDRGMDVLDGGPRAPRGTGGFGDFVPPLFWERESAFSSQTRKIFKRSYHGNYCMDFNEFFRTNIDQKICFVDGPETWITKIQDGRRPPCGGLFVCTVH